MQRTIAAIRLLLALLLVAIGASLGVAAVQLRVAADGVQASADAAAAVGVERLLDAQTALRAARGEYERIVEATFDVAGAVAVVPAVAATASAAVERAVAAGRSGASAAVQVARQLETAQGRYGRAISGSFSLGSASSGLRGAAGNIQAGLDTLPQLGVALSDAAYASESAAAGLFAVASGAPSSAALFDPLDADVDAALARLRDPELATPVVRPMRVAASVCGWVGALVALFGALRLVELALLTRGVAPRG